jgi:hypothetical protein
LLNIIGTQGQLFTVTDDLSGLLFSVNDSLGNEIFQVYDNDTILMGNSNSLSLFTTSKVVASVGTNNIYEIDNTLYDAAFFEYLVKGSGGIRSGNIYSAWSGSSVTWTEHSNTDIGDTDDVTFYLDENSGMIRLIASAATSSWTIKTIIRSI